MKRARAPARSGLAELRVVTGTASVPKNDKVVPLEKKTKPGESSPLQFKPCLQCNKTIEAGYYGRWGDAGVCEKRCNNLWGSKIHPDYYKKSI